MKRYFLAFLFLVFTLFSACQFGKTSLKTDSVEVPEPKVGAVLLEDPQYFPGHEDVTGYLARPSAQGKLPAVILIHEWWGLNDNIREFADRFAEQGYVALAVDLYDGKVATTSEEAGKLAGAVRENTPPAFENLTAAVEYLKTLPYVDTTRIASVGWCFGGGWAYEMAQNDMGTKASVMYYGHFDPEDDFEHMKSTILGHFGENDTSIPVDDVRTFQARLQTASGDHEVYIYPNAGHAFANEDGANYNKEAADTAWVRTLDFLKKVFHLEDATDQFVQEEDGSWHGTVMVRGYPEIEKLPEAFCEENCREYDYMFFHMLQTTSTGFKKFLDENQGNAFVKDYRIGLGCVQDGVIAYANDSGQNERKQYVLSPELSAEILAATKENPIALRLAKIQLFGGGEAPTCYSDITEISKL